MDLGDLNPVRILAGKGEIGKSGLGSALATLALDYFAPGLGESVTGLSGAAGTGALVGGATALASGSLQKGLMAGLSAYGTESLAAPAEKSISDAAIANAQNAAATANEIGVDAASKIAPASLSTGDAFKAGLSGLKALPTSDLLKYGAMAAAPVLLAQQNKSYGLPTGTGPSTGYIRPKVYDPATHKYYDLPAVKASDWGSQSLSDYVSSQVAPAAATTAKRGGLMAAYADGGIAGFAPDGGDGAANPSPANGSNGQLEFENEPALRMARGGIARYADGGPTAADVQNWFAANPGATDAQISAAMNQYKVDPGLVAQATGLSVGDVQSRYNAADPTGGFATGASGVSNNAINQWLGQNPTASDATIYNAMQKYGVTPQQMAMATGNPLAGEGNIADRYALAQSIIGEGNLLGQAPTTNPLGSTYDQQWAKYMDTHKDPITGQLDPVAVKEMARATGISEAEIQARYAAAEKAMQPVKPLTPITPITPIPGTSNVTQTVLPTNPGTNAPAGTTNPYGNVNNPGDITRNPDGTITVQPNIPGRPYGGFSGMSEVTNAYTAGGGHLGQVLKPTQTYQNTGGSAAAYNYLSGKGNWASTKTQPDLPVKNTYLDINNPTAAEKTLYSKYAKVWKNGALVDNPYYGDTGSSTSTTSKTSTPAATDANTGAAAARGGLMALAAGGMSDGHLGGYSDGGRLLRGPGDGVSDSIPATIGNKQPARLADGEFVVPARIVSEIGNGSTEAGARKLYAMMDRVQQARGKTVGKGKVAKNTRADKYLPA